MLLAVLVSMLIIPVVSSSIILGMKLSITLKAKVKLLGWLWGTIAQWSEHLQLEQEALGWIPGGCPVFISLVAGLIMLMG